MWHSIIQDNYICSITCILLLIFIITNKYLERDITRLFIWSIILILGLVIADNIELMTSKLTYDVLLRRIMSAVGYTIRPAVAVIVSIIFTHRNDSGKRWLTILFMMPLIINMVFCTSSIWNGCVFDYSPSNEFFRGPLGIFPFIVSGFYILMMMVFAAGKFRSINWQEATVVVMVAVLSSIAVILESVFEFEGFLNASMAVGVMLYYMFLSGQLYKRDTLTGVFNRKSFFMDAKRYAGKDMVVVSLDMNGLKAINDNYGHGEGDKAIITMSDVVAGVLKRPCRLYRIGGDEFAVLCPGITIDEIISLLEEASFKLKKTPYSFAYGMKEYHPGDDFEKILQESDKKMCEKKTLMKKKMA